MKTLHHCWQRYCRTCVRWHCGCNRCAWIDFHEVTFPDAVNSIRDHQLEVIEETQIMAQRARAGYETHVGKVRERYADNSRYLGLIDE